MKNVLKKITKSILFLLLLAVMIELTTVILLPKDIIKKYGFITAVTYPILEEKADTIDVVALGDSLVYSSISPMEIWNQYGYPMYDCAEAGMTMDEAYNYLKIIIEHQHPKIILFESNLLFRNVDKKLWYYAASDEIVRYVPINEYHNNWKLIGALPENDIPNVDKGYIYVTRTVKNAPIDYKKYTKKERKIRDKNLKIFEQMVQLCNENNIKLILVSNPSQISWRYSKHNSTEKVAKNFNLDYIDLNLINEIDIDWANETKDDGDHLNHSGAKKVSAYIGKYLHETGLLIDKRNDINYKSWNKANLMYNNHLSNY